MANNAARAKLSYLQMQADMGITKHIGGSSATKKLVQLCGIQPGMKVLDVGCGIGTTACKLAKLGCFVTGVDIRPKMIAWARKKARKERVAEKIKFAVCDARKLPFPTNSFDAVVCESVLVFVKDQQKALKEFARVVKPGGCVGLNEGTWLTETRPKEVENYWNQAMQVGYVGCYVRFLTEKGWKSLVQKTGLKVTHSEAIKINMLKEALDRIENIGAADVARSWARMITKTISSKEYREFLAKLFKDAGRVPKKVFDYWGYGVYAAKKPLK